VRSKEHKRLPSFGVVRIDGPFEPVGVGDIAERLAVGRSTVSNWLTRHPDFPSPLFVVGKGLIHVFDWSEVEQWAEEHNKTAPPKEELHDRHR
jgi:predicted DNA-binding transcriptional regulator AlpA